MEVVIISGLSGAGKSEVLNIMEDMGYFAMDNLPPELLTKFMELSSASPIEKVACVVDIRSREFFNEYDSSIKRLKNMDIDVKILFVTASDKTIVNRYKERRRPHPLDKSITEGIKKEKKLLEFLEKASDYKIDTSSMKLSNLRYEIKKLFQGEGEDFLVSVVSFGFKNGILLDGDLIFDVRFIENPFYIEELKNISGENKEVIDFVMGFEETKEFIDKTVDMLRFLIPNYKKEGKNILVVGFGCTGGFHRSVAISNEVAKRLEEIGYKTNTTHRDKP